MEPLSQLLAYEFIRNAVYVAILASLLCGVIGTFVVVRRLVFLSGGISVLGSVLLAIAFLFVAPVLLAGAMIVGIGDPRLDLRERASALVA